jgi:hypothetical protein
VENVSLIPLITIPSRVFPGNPTELAFTSNNTSTKLETAQMSYTTNNWANTNTLNMNISNQTCNATIPGQPAGTLVQYQINATDILENGLYTSGNYTVKEPLTLNITAVENKIRLGENITINGILTPNYNDSFVALNSNESVAVSNSNDSMATPNYNGSVAEVQFSSVNSALTINCTVNSDGTFVATFRPAASGLWTVTATCPETQTSYSCYSQQLTITVTPQPLYAKYSFFIIAGFVAAIAAGGVVYFLKFRVK